jgi:ferredoxin
LTIWNKLDPENIQTVSVNCCPSILKKHADCSYLEAQAPGIYKKQVGIDNTQSLESLQAHEDHELFSRWMYEFQKCLKCYGCRNICPVCFCEDCSLEHKDLVGTGKLPPDVPIFHLVRAVHMAGRCIDCGLCEDACPVDIPLRLLYRKVNALCSELFEYEPGVSDGQSPFNIIGSEVTLEPKPMLDDT